MELVKDKGNEADQAEAMRAELSVLAGDPKVKRMLEILETLKAAQPQPAQPRISNLQTLMNGFRDSHTDEECLYAKDFILRVFADCIPEEAAEPHLILVRINVKKETRGIANPSCPNGFIESRGVNVEHFSLYYIDPIVKGWMAEKTDEEIVWDIIEHTQSDPLNIGSKGWLHPNLRFLIKEENGEQTLELWTHYVGFKPGDE